MADQKISTLDTAAALTGAELIEVVQSGVNKKSTISAVLTLLIGSASVIAFCGTFDLSTNIVPVTGGTGSGGAIKKGNLFYVTDSATTVLGPDGGPVLEGYLCLAIVDAPGTLMNDKTKWLLISTIV